MQVGNATITPSSLFIRNNASASNPTTENKETPVVHELKSPLKKAPGDRSASYFQNLLSMPGLDEYQNQLEEQGRMEQSMVIRKGSQVMGTVGRNGWAMLQESSLNVLWDRANGNTATFAQLLERHGYEVENFKPGAGPSYAEVHEMIHHESYNALVARQSIEYCQELNCRTGFAVY